MSDALCDASGGVVPQATAPAAPSLAWTRLDTLILAGITLVAGTVRVMRLGTPTQYIWDEFYAQDACFYLHMPASVCDTDQELTWTHPPLGKWLIAIGIKTFGYTPFGRRVAAVAIGTLAVALLYLLGRKILRSRLGGAVAATLLTIDWLHFVQSRSAMLDVFLSTFAIAALLFLVWDRDRLVSNRISPTSLWRSALNRPWRLASGAMVACACATKWSGALLFLAVFSLTALWEVAARRASGTPHSLKRALNEEWPSIAVGLIAIPLLIYLLSYSGAVHDSFAGKMQGTVLAWPWSRESWFRDFARRQVQMFQFHRTLVGVHLYASSGWTWPLLKRPLLCFFDGTGGSIGEILATGNPLVWWPALAALLYIAGSWVRRRNFMEPHGIILAGFVANYVPWIFLTRLRTLGFIYYIVPAIPSMCLALSLVAARAESSRGGKIMLGLGLAMALALFVVYYPILAALPISRSHWELLIPFWDCQGVIEPGFHGGPPPPGWCWI